MTRNIEVHCKNQPTVSDLIEQLNLEPASPLKGYKTYRWVPKGEIYQVLIVLKEEPVIVSAAYDKSLIDESIGLAKFAGVDVPDELVQKFVRDNALLPGQLCTFVVDRSDFAVDPNESGVRESNTVRPSCSESEAYTIRADEGLYHLATKYPLLEGVDPYFKLPFGLVKHTKGLPTYEVGLETVVSASKETLEGMVKWAVYFAEAFDGVIYDTDNNKFGTPDADKLHRQGMELLSAVVKDLKALGAEFNPAVSKTSIAREI